MASSFESTVVITRRRTAFVAPVVVASFIVIAGSLTHVHWLAMAGSALQIAGCALLFLYLRNTWPVRRTRRLRADARGVWLDGALAVPAPSIQSAYALPGAKPVVRIVRHYRAGAPLDVHLESADGARELLDALGLGVARSTARFTALYGGMRRQMLMAAVFFGVIPALLGFGAYEYLAHDSIFPLVLAGLVYILGLFALLRNQARVVVGADGVLVSRVGAKEFVPYESIESLVPEKNDLAITRRGKPPLRLGFGLRRLVGTEFSREALLKRIEDARPQPVGPSNAAALVARGERSGREWLSAIRELMRDPGYRQTTLPPERLWRIVEDPASEASSRAGAAAALVASLDDEGRQRLRIAAQACASPQLRVAIEAAATTKGDDDVLEEAFESLARKQRAG